MRASSFRKVSLCFKILRDDDDKQIHRSHRNSYHGEYLVGVSSGFLFYHLLIIAYY